MKAIAFSFKEWLYENDEYYLIEAIIQKGPDGRPLQLDLVFPHGETNPPYCKRNQIQFDGPGLICFDFDQTLTTAFFGHPDIPTDKGSHSTRNPNPKMINMIPEHKAAGNKCIIVTARGEKENQLRGDKTHASGLQPTLTPDPSIPYSGMHGPKPEVKRDWPPEFYENPAWRPIMQHMSIKDVFLLGAVSLGLGHNATESKGPFIAPKMAKFKCDWGILYDDGMSNVKSANAQQQKGIALVGIPVNQHFDKGGEPPAGVDLQMNRTGAGM